jgi:hypothetical protein
VTSAFAAAALRSQGFIGFKTVSELQATRCDAVPREPGVYVVIRESREAASWLRKSSGGWFKQKDPTVPAATLAVNWVDGTDLLYIGKADQLQRRLRQYMDFGAGKPIGHWGGRLIWQVDGSKEFVVAWAVDPEPLRREAKLFQTFVDEFGAMPFANLRR